MVSNKKIHRGFEYSYNSYEQYPLEKFFIFTIYQKCFLNVLMFVICLMGKDKVFQGNEAWNTPRHY